MMSVYIDQVLDYLDDHLVCRCADNMELLLGICMDFVPQRRYNESK